MELEDTRQWVGRTELGRDVATASVLARLAATLDHEEPPWVRDVLPPLGHWLFFQTQTTQSGIGVDGHPRRGGFLPPIELPRRMWAAGSLTFHLPIPVGVPLTRRSSIAEVTPKTGKSGRLVFVKVRHVISTPGGPAVTEVQEIVYRDKAAAHTAAQAPEEMTATPAWSRTIIPDPVLLFRYSALTFNAHRIHYDRPYATETEGYPGLVVHGPLTATLLVDLFLRHNPQATVTAFRFRARRPLFDGWRLTLCGAPRASGADLWAVDDGGEVAMTAEIQT